jgi:hypothetical protein
MFLIFAGVDKPIILTILGRIKDSLHIYLNNKDLTLVWVAIIIRLRESEQPAFPIKRAILTLNLWPLNVL